MGKRGFVLVFCLVVGWSSGVVADTGLPLLGEEAPQLLEKEDAIGRGIYRQLSERGLIIEDPLLNEYLAGIGQELLGGVDRRLREYHFFLVADDTVNAFAAPGGYVGVHLGMIDQLDTEDELAAVLAHEIAHVRLRHGLQMLEKMDEVNWLSMLGVINAVLLSAKDPDAAAAMLVLTQAGSTQSLINFTRGNEYEADREGLQLLESSAYDPWAMSDLMTLLQRKERSGELVQIEYLRTHPISANRVAEIRSRLSGQGKPVEHSRFDQFRDYLFFLYPLHIGQKRPGRFAQALSAMQDGAYGQAEVLLDQLIEEDPDSIWYRAAAAENRMRARQYDDAAQIYRSLLELYPGHVAIRLRLAEVRLQQKKYRLAAELLESMRREGEPDPRLFTLLVQLYQHLGEVLNMRLAQADYLWLTGDRKEAEKQYRKLLGESALPLSEREKIRQKLDEQSG